MEDLKKLEVDIDVIAESFLFPVAFYVNVVDFEYFADYSK